METLLSSPGHKIATQPLGEEELKIKENANSAKKINLGALMSIKTGRESLSSSNGKKAKIAKQI